MGPNRHLVDFTYISFALALIGSLRWWLIYNLCRITSENPTHKSNSPGSPHAARVPACQTSRYSYL